MKGTDVNERQRVAAERFICEHVVRRPPPAAGQQVAMTWGELVQLVAWYGAIRAQGVAAGTSTVDDPAPVGVRGERP